MKKVTLLFFVLIAFSINRAFAESSFELVESESEINVSDPSKFTSEIEAKFDFKNITQSVRIVVPSIIIDELNDGHELSICTYFCYPYTTRTITFPDEIEIPAEKKISQVFGYLPTAHCKPNGNIGQTRFRVRFTNVADENDFIDVPFTFNIGLTSVNDLNPNEFVVAYPNPTNNILSVYSEVLSINKIEIYDINGKKWLSEQSNNNYKTLDLSRFPKGSYLMLVYLADGKINKQTVIVD